MSISDQIEGALRRSASSPLDPPDVERRAAGAAAGLLDVAYATLDSPVGTLLSWPSPSVGWCGSRT